MILFRKHLDLLEFDINTDTVQVVDGNVYCLLFVLNKVRVISFNQFSQVHCILIHLEHFVDCLVLIKIIT